MIAATDRLVYSVDKGRLTDTAMPWQRSRSICLSAVECFEKNYMWLGERFHYFDCVTQ